MIEWYWCVVIVIVAVLVTIIAMAICGLFGRRTDFEADECEWESGSVNVKEYNKTQSNIDAANSVRDEFNKESG